MGRGSDQAQQITSSGQNISNNAAGQANGLYNVLAPALQAEAAHPTGIDPATLAQEKTAAQQTAGGTQAAATGQGALLAARTRNAGGAQNAIAEAARTGGKQLSQANLGIENQNAQAKLKQQQAGLSGLEGLFGTTSGTSIGGLNAATGGVNANNAAVKNSWNWATDILDPALQTAGQSKYV